MGSAAGWATRKANAARAQANAARAQKDWESSLVASWRTEQRRLDAELVRAAGCLCGELNGSLECMADWDDNGRLENHDPRCPAALALAIEASRG